MHAPAPRRGPRLARDFLRLLLTALVYLILARLGDSLAAWEQELLAFWPCSGFLVGMLCAGPLRDWWAVALGGLLGGWLVNQSLGLGDGLNLGISLINVGEALLGVGLLRGVRHGPFRLETPGDVILLFALPGVLACGLGGLAGGALLVEFSPGADLGTKWKIWSLADCAGVMLFAPLMLSWNGGLVRRVRRATRQEALEAVGLFSLTALASWGVFVADARSQWVHYLLLYLLIPGQLVLTLRLGLAGSALASLGLGVTAMLGTADGRGWDGLVRLGQADRVIFVQGFSSVAALTALILATALRQRDAREREIHALNLSLQSQMEQNRQTTLRHEAIFNSMNSYLGLLTPEGTLLAVNQRALDDFGASEEEVLGQPFWETIWWRGQPELQATLRHAIRAGARGESSHLQNTHHLPNGERVDVDFALKPIFDRATGRVIYLVPQGHNVTRLKAVERELYSSREQLELALQATQEGIWDWDVRTDAVFYSSRWKSMLGYADGEILPQPGEWRRLVHPDDLPRAEQALAAYFSGTCSQFSLELRMLHKDGTPRWILTRGILQRDAEGRPTRLTGSHADTTERRAVADLLATNEALLRQFIVHAPAAMAMLDGDLRYLRTSDRWLSDYHLRGESILGRDLYAVTPELPARWEPLLRRVLQGSVEGFAEDTLVGSSGGTEWVQWEARPWRRGSGSVGGVILFTQSITERKRTEAALRESEERYRQLVQGVREYAIFRLDATGRIASWNAGAQRLLGYETEEILDRTLAVFYPPEADAATKMSEDLRAAAHEGRFEEDGWRRRKDGGLLWANVTLAPLRDRERGLRGFAVIARDLTERRKAEEAMRESEERFRSAFDSAAIGMALVGLDGRWMKVNAAICEILGYPAHELLQTDFQTITHPDDLESDLGRVRQVLAGEIHSYQMEKRYFHRSGRVVHALLSVSLVRNTAGEALYFVSQVEDISQRKQSQSRLLQSLHEKEVMLREIHHRVKNNLAIVASLFQLQSMGAESGPVVTMLREAQNRVRSMALVHEHLYNSSNLAAVQFHEYAQSLAREVIETFRLPGQQVRYLNAASPLMLSIEQAIPAGLLLNELLTNSLKHAFRDGQGGEVTLQVRQDGEWGVIGVADDGQGLPPELDLTRLASLGMRLVHSLGRQLGGRVEFLPRSPRGTEARVRFRIEAMPDGPTLGAAGPATPLPDYQ